MTNPTALVSGPQGWTPGTPYDIKLINRRGTTINIGQVLELNVGLNGAETTEYALGADASGFSSVIQPVLGTTTGAIPLVIALESVADDTAGMFRLMGEVDCFLVDGGANNDVLVTDLIIAESASNSLEADQAATGRICGFTMITATQAISTGALVRCYFDGYHFMGLT